MINLRTIKCNCKDPNCITGISFDGNESKDAQCLLRFHDKNNLEQIMYIGNKEIDDLIKLLKSFKIKNKK